MNKKKNHIFLLVQSGYSTKNFVLSGFLNQKDAKISFWSDQDYIQQYQVNNNFIKLPKYSYSGKLNFLQKLKTKSEIFFNIKKFKNKDYKFYLFGITKRKASKAIIKDKLTTLIAFLFSNKRGIQFLDKPFNTLTRRTQYYRECVKQLKEHNPTVVFCTHQRASSGVAPVLAARDLGIKTVCFIHSWDNIPKGVQLIKSDQYFVWSDYMKKEMIAHYPFINPQNIKVTGTPQFIPYLQEENRLSREEFLKQFKLDINKKYILFSGNDKTTSPNDPIYLKDLCKTIIQLNSKNDDNYRIIFRPNPIDRNEGFNLVLEQYSELITELKPDWFGSDTFVWNKGGPSKRDLLLLVNTILHSELVINMGSTMALDAALLKKASCYINYDVESKYDWTVKRIYRFIHFKMIKKINPVFWVNKRGDMFNVINEALNHPEKTELGRNLWINNITEQPIEETNNRMWRYLLESNEA